MPICAFTVLYRCWLVRRGGGVPSPARSWRCRSSSACGGEGCDVAVAACARQARGSQGRQAAHDQGQHVSHELWAQQAQQAHHAQQAQRSARTMRHSCRSSAVKHSCCSWARMSSLQQPGTACRPAHQAGHCWALHAMHAAATHQRSFSHPAAHRPPASWQPPSPERRQRRLQRLPRQQALCVRRPAGSGLKGGHGFTLAQCVLRSGRVQVPRR